MVAEPVLSTRRKSDQSQLRRLLVKAFRSHQPEFRFLTFATGAYYFQRVRDFYDMDLSELVHVVYDATKKTMCCSVASRLNPIYQMSPVYGEGILNAHVDLIAIKRGYTIYPSDEQVYRCDGTLEGATGMIGEMLNDFSTAGIRFLDARLRELWSQAVVRRGLDKIDAWEYDPTMLRNELVKQLRTAKGNPLKLKHRVVNELRNSLMLVPDTSPDMQRRIPELVFELLELYCGRISV